MVGSRASESDREAGRGLSVVDLVVSLADHSPPFDSLGERLNNSLPRLSRLKRFYGKGETGSRLRNARHVDLESASARPATRSCDRGPDPADIERYFARRAGFALSRALSFGSARLDQG